MDFKELYRVGKKIRDARFGCVRACISRKSDNLRCVRVYYKSMMDDFEKKIFFNELNHMSELQHPNIIQYQDIFEDYKRYFVVYNHAGFTDLFDKISQGGVTETEAQNIMKMLMSCINFFNFKRVVHRDLKPENILITND